MVVLVLGLLAIVFAEHVPDWLDAVMERLVGVTLLALGFYVVYSLVRHGRGFRMRAAGCSSPRPQGAVFDGFGVGAAPTARAW